MANKNQIRRGDTVHFRTHRDGHIKAEVTNVRSDGTVDLKCLYLGSELIVTSSPRDDAGNASDSWRPIKEDWENDGETAEPETASAAAPIVPIAPAAPVAVAAK